MAFDSSTYPIGAVAIPWGLTLDEVENCLPGYEWWPPYGGWPNLRGVCQSVFGLAATECNLRAPARYKPVLQVSYELAPPQRSYWPWQQLARRQNSASPAYWVQQLTALLGSPSAAQAHNQSWSRGPGGVVYTAQWQVAAVRISLSVYGGVREQKGGPAAAGLFMDWEDELTAAQPFFEAAQAQSAILEVLAGSADFQRFSTQLPQTAYQMPQHGESVLHPAPVAELLRQSQRALYREGLCDTPTHLQLLLGTGEVALWAVPTQDYWAVSTHWDTVLLNASSPNISLVTLLPAKGSGAVSLSVGGLSLHDSYGSGTLATLATAIERHTGWPVSRAEDYDC